MNSQQFAVSVASLIDKVSVPATKANGAALVEIHQILDALAKGQLILANGVPETAPKE